MARIGLFLWLLAVIVAAWAAERHEEDGSEFIIPRGTARAVVRLNLKVIIRPPSVARTAVTLLPGLPAIVLSFCIIMMKVKTEVILLVLNLWE